MGGKTSTESKRRYNQKSYDRISLTVPKGQAETIKAVAARRGESVNAYVTRAILQRMRLKQWPELRETETEC